MVGSRGHEAIYTAHVLPGDTPDAVIARYAADERLTIITKDEDFYGLRARHDFALIWLRCGNLKNAELYQWFEQRWRLIERLLIEGERLVILR